MSSASTLPERRILAQPRMALSGVRSSWESGGEEFVLHAVGRFGLGPGGLGGGEQPLPLRLGPLAVGDVAGDLRGPDDRAVGVADRRDGERDVDDAPVLGDALGLEVLDPLAPADALQDAVHVLGMVRRHQGGDGLADDLGGGVAEDPLGGLHSSS